MVHCRQRWVTLLVLLLAPLAAYAEPPEQADAPKSPADPRAVEVRFQDDSVLRVRLADQQIEITTKHGNLTVPTDQIKRLYFAQRLDTKTQAKIDKAVANLADPAAAQAARDELLGLEELAYPALRRLVSNSDAPGAESARKLRDELEQRYESRVSTLRDTDLIETSDGKIVGRLTRASLRIETKQFGELTMNLADVRSLRSQSLIKEEPKPKEGEVLPNPGNLKQFEAQIDKTFRFEVIGGTGSCWGTDTYTTDSQLAAAAVHAGVVKLGEVGVVEVKIVVAPPNFLGSTRNGITTRPWGQYPGAFEIIKPKPKPKPRDRRE